MGGSYSHSGTNRAWRRFAASCRGRRRGRQVSRGLADGNDAPSAGGRAASGALDSEPVTTGALTPTDDGDFDRLTRLAAGAFGVLICMDGRLVSASASRAMPEPAALAEVLTVLEADGTDAIVVADAVADRRLRTAALVAAGEVGFVVVVPIKVQGQWAGWLGAFDRQSRPVPDPGQCAQLADLAAIAGSLFERRDEARVRAQAAAELVKEEWRHALTLEAGKVGSWVWDVDTREVAANDIMRRMYHIDPLVPVTIDDIFAFIHPDDLPRVQAALETSFTQGSEFFSEFRVASGRWLIGRGRVYQRDSTGRPVVMMGVNIDVTEARLAAEHTRFLLRELNHRVKNTLAVIQSLARQTLRRSADPQHFLEAFSGRLRTVSDVHALLSERDWSGIGLLELIETQVRAHLPLSSEQLVVAGEDVQLPPDHALGLGLILHELASNAIRFGALSTPAGKVNISWPAESGHLALLWEEAEGPPVKPRPELGFGSRLIRRSLDKILDSRVTLSFPPTGVEVRVMLPLPAS